MSDKYQDKKDGVESKYAKKRRSGNMMYGPGCGANKVTEQQVRAAKIRAVERGHFDLPAAQPAQNAEVSRHARAGG